MANPLGGNGPRVGRSTGRSRNTLVNNASKLGAGGYQAPVSSAGAVGYGSQLAAARYQYLQQLASLKAQRGLLQQQYKVGVADARAAVPGQIAAYEQDATARGVLGSSADLSGRAGALAARTRAIADASAQRATGRLDLLNQRIGAQGAYYGDVANIQNQMAQEQMANTTNAFGNDQFDALQQNYQSMYQDILQRLRAQKSGSAPRQRNGVNNGIQADPRNPNRGYGASANTTQRDWYMV